MQWLRQWVTSWAKSPRIKTAISHFLSQQAHAAAFQKWPAIDFGSCFKSMFRQLFKSQNTYQNPYQRKIFQKFQKFVHEIGLLKFVYIWLQDFQFSEFFLICNFQNFFLLFLFKSFGPDCFWFTAFFVSSEVLVLIFGLTSLSCIFSIALIGAFEETFLTSGCILNSCSYCFCVSLKGSQVVQMDTIQSFSTSVRSGQGPFVWIYWTF